MSHKPEEEEEEGPQQEQQQYPLVDNCIFCRIARHEIKPGRRRPNDNRNSQQQQQESFLYESDSVVAFRDAAPVSDFHVLIIPKQEHRRTCWDLTSALVQEMKQVAEQLVLLQHEQQQQQQEQRESSSAAAASSSGDNHDGTLLFFSRPPFFSVPHVHLHVITRPLTKFSFWNPLHYHYYMPALHVTLPEVEAYLDAKTEKTTAAASKL